MADKRTDESQVFWALYRFHDDAPAELVGVYAVEDGKTVEIPASDPTEPVRPTVWFWTDSGRGSLGE